MLQRGTSKSLSASSVAGRRNRGTGARTCLAAACLRVGVAQDAMPDSHGLQRPCPPCPISLWLTSARYLCVLGASTCIRKVPTSTTCTDACLVALSENYIASRASRYRHCRLRTWGSWSSTPFNIENRLSEIRATTRSTPAATRGPQTLLCCN